VAKLNIPQDELDAAKELIPAHLHKWLDYLPEPEPDWVLTLNEERNGITPGSYIPGLTDVVRAKPQAKPVLMIGGSTSPGPRAELKPKPGLNAKPQNPDVGAQKSLLDLALSDEDEDA
jgi:hypothetical protein